MTVAITKAPRPSLQPASRPKLARQFRVIPLELPLQRPPIKDDCPLPFNKWVMPPQEERYLKGKKHDFF